MLALLGDAIQIGDEHYLVLREHVEIGTARLKYASAFWVWTTASHAPKWPLIISKITPTLIAAVHLLDPGRGWNLCGLLDAHRERQAGTECTVLDRAYRLFATVDAIGKLEDRHFPRLEPRRQKFWPSWQPIVATTDTHIFFR